MASKSVLFNEENFYEWLCSTGHLLPRNELELSRFERLNPIGSIRVNENAIDPLAIISGEGKYDKISTNKVSFEISENQELRLAARKYDGLPPEILEKIKRSQQDIDDNTSK